MTKSRKSKPHSGVRFRLKERGLWWRHAGWFTFAHKPLCDHYQHDTFALGKYRICRSCTLVYSGFFATILCIILLFPLTVITGWVTLSLISATSILSYPPLYKGHSRFLRDILRSSLGVSIAMTLGLLASKQLIFGISAVAALGGFWLVFGRLRQTTKRSKCQTCPEYSESAICSGYKRQSESIRGYEKDLEDKLRGTSGTIPAIITEKLKERS